MEFRRTIREHYNIGPPLPIMQTPLYQGYISYRIKESIYSCEIAYMYIYVYILNHSKLIQY